MRQNFRKIMISCIAENFAGKFLRQAIFATVATPMAMLYQAERDA